MLYIIDFLKNYAEIITSLAAILAVLIYFKQKRDRVSEAATVILLEIRQAERRISALRESGFVNISDNQLIITNNNWKNHSHLFARKFDHDELDLINRFYSNCQAIDRYTAQVSPEEQVRAKTIAFQESLCTLALKHIMDDAQYRSERDAFMNRINSENTTLTPTAPRDQIAKRLNAIESVTTTSAGIKLKKLANRWW